MRKLKQLLLRRGMVPRILIDFLQRISDSPLRSRVASGVFWSVSGGGASRLLALLSAVVIARIIGRKEFGELGIIQNTVGVFSLVAAFGMDTTTMKYVAEFRSKDPARTGRIIRLAEMVSAGVGLSIALVFVVLSPWVAGSILAAPHLKPLLQVGAVLLFCGAVNSSQTGSLAGFEAFKTIMIINVITGAISFTTSLIGVYYLGLQGVVYAMIATMAVTLAINHIMVGRVAKRSNVVLSYRSSFQERSIIMKFSLPAMLSGIVVMAATWLSTAMLVNSPFGYEEMGMYNAANVWKAPILFFPSVFATIFLSIMSNLAGEKNQESYDKVLKYYLVLNGGIALVVAAVIALFSSSIMSVYGSEFSGGGIVLMILALASIPVAVGNVLDNAISSHGKAWVSLVINSAWACVCIGLTWALLGWGAKGLVTALGISYALLALGRGSYLYGALLARSRAVPLHGSRSGSEGI